MYVTKINKENKNPLFQMQYGECYETCLEYVTTIFSADYEDASSYCKMLCNQ